MGLSPDYVLDKIESESRAESRAMSEIDMKEFTSKFQSKNKDSRKNTLQSRVIVIKLIKTYFGFCKYEKEGVNTVGNRNKRRSGICAAANDDGQTD